MELIFEINLPMISFLNDDNFVPRATHIKKNGKMNHTFSTAVIFIT